MPDGLLSQSECWLFGHVTFEKQSIYITASSHHSNHEHKIGLWAKGKTVQESKVHRQCEVWVDIQLNENGLVQCAVLIHDNRVLCTCVIFNPNELLMSDILCLKLQAANGKHDNILDLANVLQQNSCPSETSTIVHYCKQHAHNANLVTSLFHLFSVCTLFYHLLHWICQFCKRHSSEKERLLQYTPSFLSQLLSRSYELHYIRVTEKMESFQRLKNENRCVIQIIDTLLGIVFMYILISNNTSQYLANVCLSLGDWVANELKRLLEWLMGAPAGLKLNSQLTHFLGKFFQYHIYLWTGYLYILRPVLEPLLYYSSMAGVLGFTVQVALFQDILSTMTIHIYCFYVYAARLYQLQLYALASLWRLFRGKKWNVLRQRVDSAVYDADQLFVGILLFTVLLFILPTTGLYYVVFTMLRVLVLLTQWCLSRLRHILNTMPWWSVLLWMTRSQTLTDGALFEVASYSTSCLVLSLQGTRPSFSDVLTITKDDTTMQKSYSWGAILKNLFQGDLIYPWIERKKCDNA